MKIKDMEIFLDLLNTQSPTHTANNFSITQPNVSIVIKNLENKFDGILFERLGKKLLPTPKALELGKNWLKIIQAYYQSLEKLNDESMLLGEIKIASTQSISEHFLAPILFDFKAEFKNIEIRSQTQNSKECLNLLKNGNIEFAIIEAELDEISLHVSTQANILNYLDAQVYKDMGAKRVVIARELGLKDAKALKENCDIELEAFVHGSMCFAYSGRCLISSVQSGRMSNRGSCANDCRFNYELYAKNPENGTLFRLEEDENGTHVFNSKDLNLCSYIEKIMQENCISAFKIEGRTKSEYYVALTTRTYKMAIQDALEGKFESSKYEKEIATLKNRGFTDGYLVSRPLEKTDTQNHNTSIEEGSHQVHAISEDGSFFKCKGKIVLNTPYEILAPLGDVIQTCDNELGKIYQKEDKYFIEFKKLIAKNNKEFSEIHSGNEHEIQLPNKISALSFLRKEI